MCKIKVGDLVTPSRRAILQRWFKNYMYLINAELLVTKVEKANTFSGWVVYFHDPCFGIRKWRTDYLELLNFSLENE